MVALRESDPASGDPSGGGPTAGVSYAALISEQLETERARKTSLEQRGITVITTSGALVTLLFALAALITGENEYSPPTLAVVLLTGALAAFLLASIAALLTNTVRDFHEADEDVLATLLQDQYWVGRAVVGEKRAAEVRVSILKTARDLNTKKAEILKLAMRAEVAAVCFVAAAVATILITAQA